MKKKKKKLKNLKKLKKLYKRTTFKPGTVVIFDAESFSANCGLTEEEMIKFYGPLGYGQETLKRFVFLCEIRNAPGHCVLVALDDQKIETMRHTDDFREVKDEEF